LPAPEVLVLDMIRFGSGPWLALGGDREVGPQSNLWSSSEGFRGRELAGGRRLYDGVSLGSRHGLLVGFGGAFLETFDGGKTWSDRSLLSEPWLAGVAAHGQEVWLVGAAAGAPVLLRSLDGAANFVDLAGFLPADTGALRAVQALGPGRMIAVGEGGTVVMTADGGETFARGDSGTTAWLRSVHAQGERLVIGGKGLLLTSEDGGRTWTTLELPGVKLNAVCWVGGGQVLAAGMGGRLWLLQPASRRAEVLFEGSVAITGITPDGPGVWGVCGERRLLRVTLR
jgi:Photosynthesis system II assembly factor YCF48